MICLSVEEIIDKLSHELPSKRYKHTLGVAYTATSLAMVHGCDMKKAEVAGLLHDCAKALSLDQMLEIAKEYNLILRDTEKVSPNLLHGKVGACLAKNMYGIEEEEILSAICFHTTGKPNMTLLEKIVYIADYIEPSRDKQKHLNEIRKMAFVDLDKALFMILDDTVSYLRTTDYVIDSLSEETYLFYKENT